MFPKIVISSDEYHPILDHIIDHVKKRGYEPIYFGPKKGEKEEDWTRVTLQAMKEIEGGKAKEGIVLCWTGTGCSILANKCRGVRAALCIDGETAKGARIYNHANVLALSLRLITPEKVQEILNLWFSTPFSKDPWNLSQVKVLQEKDLPLDENRVTF